MTTPPLAETVKGRGRHYRDPATGELYPSVTNILGVIDKPAIAWWQTKGALAAAYDDRAAFSRMIDRDTAVKAYQSAAFKQRDKAADLGSHIHAVCDALSSDAPLPEVGDAAGPYVDQFVAWVSENDVKVLHSERTVISTEHRYGGTFDLLVWLDGLLWLVDIKTGKAVYPEAALQLAALAHAGTLCDPGGGVETFMLPERAGVLHLQADGHELVEADIGAATFEAFLGARALWEFVKGGGAESALGGGR
jgi:hypothetical protein